MRRGEIWWATLPARGSRHQSPVVVIQDNSFNESRISTVIVAAITSDMTLAAAPGNVVIVKDASTLSDDSVVNVAQLLTVDKRLLTENVGRLSDEIMDTIDDGLRLVLSL